MPSRTHRAWQIALATGLTLSAISLSACVTGTIIVASETAFHVAPDGDDASAGTATDPWRTIQHAVDQLSPGQTAYVHEGIYSERIEINVSGDEAAGPVTLAAAPDEHAILDGNGLPIPEGDSAMILIENRSHVVVRGLEIRGLRASTPSDFPAGILIVGSSEDITIDRCVVHDIGSNLPAPDGDGPFANGIAVYGTRTTPARDIAITCNELYDLELGGSEALVVNGNVDGFEILGNHIHHVNNIAIDCIGFEGIAPLADVDQARNGLVAGNLIRETSGAGNAYYGTALGALGIYVDGGRDILISGNTVLRTDFGIEVASEHVGRAAAGITVVSNVIAESRTVGLSIGGWIEAWGGAEDIVVANNTFVRNDTLRDGHGEVALLRHLEDILFANNIVVANEGGPFLLNEAPTGSEVTSHHNLYVSPDGSADGLWIWDGVEFATFDAYRAASGQDGSSLVADPAFRDVDALDVRLLPTSPAIDAGDNAAVPAVVAIDHAESDRTVDGDGDGIATVDLGAFEFEGAAD